ncbi:MAG: hypothetical protein K2K36_09760 [Muribaculaceae bacterium]|nr:hypothetical protein [Muribaculaceae bacterium]
MKKIYTMLSLVALSLVCALSSHAASFILNVDNAEAIQVKKIIYSPYGQTILDLVTGPNVIEFDENEYTNITLNANSGWGLVSVTSDDPSSYGDISVYSDMAYIYPDELYEGRVYNVTTLNKDDTRTASVTVTVTDTPSLIRINRAGEYLDITESPQIIKFNPETESTFQVFRNDYQDVCNVKLNNVSLSNTASMFQVSDGDEIEVTAEFPDVQIPVTITFPAETPNVIRSVSVDSQPVTDWDSEDFTVKAGSRLAMQLNDSDYKIDRVLVNDEVKSSYSNYYDFKIGIEPVDIVVESHVWTDLNFTVNIENPAHVTVSTYSGHTFALKPGSNALSVSEKDPKIIIKAGADYIIDSLTDGDGNPITLDSYSKSMTVTDGMVVNIETSAKEFDASFVVYLDSRESLYTGNWADEENREYHDLTAGYNIVKFISKLEIVHQISVSGSNMWYAYLNGEPVNNEYYSSYYNWRGIPEDGMVIKLYTSGTEPELHSVNLSVAENIADKVAVKYDKILDWEEFGTPASLPAGTHIDITLADDADAMVLVDGTPLTPAENGAHTITVAADHEITVSGADAITGTEAAAEAAEADVYNLQGIRVLSGATAADLEKLPAGLYIHGGKKVIVK